VPARMSYDRDTGQWSVYELSDLRGATAAAPQQQQQPAIAVDAAVAAELEQQGDDPDVLPSDLDDGDRSPHYSDSSTDGNTLGGAQRTVPLVSGSSDARMLAVSADKRQGVWTVRYRRGNQRKWRWAFLGLRFVRSSDSWTAVTGQPTQIHGCQQSACAAAAHSCWHRKVVRQL
jgi:hypothetical protein